MTLYLCCNSSKRIRITSYEKHEPTQTGQIQSNVFSSVAKFQNKPAIAQITLFEEFLSVIAMYYSNRNSKVMLLLNAHIHTDNFVMTVRLRKIKIVVSFSGIGISSF